MPLEIFFYNIYTINIEPNSKIPVKLPKKQLLVKKTIYNKVVRGSVEAGLIYSSKSPYAAPTVFLKKPEVDQGFIWIIEL